MWTAIINNNLSNYFSLDLDSVTEISEDCILQVEVIIGIDMSSDTNRAADLIDQFKEQDKWIMNC